MSDLNKCMFIGRLVQNPEVRYSANGDAMCSFTLACNWKTKTKEGAEFVRIVSYKRLAEVVGEYMKKGSQMYVEGRMNTRQYEKDGQTRYSTEVIADQIQMLGHANGGQDQPKQQKQPQAQSVEDMEDSIPF